MLELLPVPLEIIEVPDGLPDSFHEVDAAVDQIWADEKKRRPQLFDGQIFTIEKLSPQQATGRFVPYRYFMAQLIRPQLIQSLRLQVLAVTGILHCPDGIVFGCRNSTLTQQGGSWELVPAGGMERHGLETDGHINAAKQLLIELEEELGMSADVIIASEPCCLIRDSDRHVMDIAIYMQTDCRAAEIEAIHRKLQNPEHVKLRIVPLTALEEFMAEVGEAFLPINTLILKERGYLSSSVTPQS